VDQAVVAVPLIYTRDTLPPAMRGWMRMLAAAIALGCLAVLVTGMWLTPNGAQGISTHTQMAFPPCAFEMRTGLPCPSCGFTTSVSYFSHGNVLASLYLQPMGFVIAVLCAVSAWVGFYVAITGRPVYRLLALLPGRTWVLGLAAMAIAGWAWKILIHLTGHDHWPL
jgi:hypothetical protein